MATDIYVVKVLGNIRAARSNDKDIIDKLPSDQLIKMTYSIPRNPKFHAKFMGMINLAFQNQNEKLAQYTDFNKFRKDLIIEAGFYEEHVDFNGQIKREAKSIAFGNMDEDEFSNVFNAVADVICQLVIPGIKRQDIIDNLVGFM